MLKLVDLEFLKIQIDFNEKDYITNLNIGIFRSITDLTKSTFFL